MSVCYLRAEEGEGVGVGAETLPYLGAEEEAEEVGSGEVEEHSAMHAVKGL